MQAIAFKIVKLSRKRFTISMSYTQYCLFDELRICGKGNFRTIFNILYILVAFSLVFQLTLILLTWRI